MTISKERMAIFLEAKQAAEGKSGMELLEVLTTYSDRLAKTAPMTTEEKKTLMALLFANLNQNG